MPNKQETLLSLQYCDINADDLQLMASQHFNDLLEYVVDFAKRGYIAGFNNAVSSEAREQIGITDFDSAIKQIIAGKDDPLSKPLPDPDNEAEEAAEIEAEKEQDVRNCKDCVHDKMCTSKGKPVVCISYSIETDAKKSARSGVFNMMDYRHAQKEPGVAMCGGKLTPNIEVTEGSRVTCPLCIDAIENQIESSEGETK